LKIPNHKTLLDPLPIEE
jgi:hypothetical protein